MNSQMNRKTYFLQIAPLLEPRLLLLCVPLPPPSWDLVRSREQSTALSTSTSDSLTLGTELLLKRVISSIEGALKSLVENQSRLLTFGWKASRSLPSAMLATIKGISGGMKCFISIICRCIIRI